MDLLVASQEEDSKQENLIHFLFKKKFEDPDFKRILQYYFISSFKLNQLNFQLWLQLNLNPYHPI